MANIDVLDRRRSRTLTSADAFFEARSNRVDHTIIVDQTWSIHRICSHIRQLGMVGVLRLLCHGDSSYLQLGTGISEPDDTREFRLLRNFWAGAFPRIEIHGCGVASATPVGCDFNLRQMRLDCVEGTDPPGNPGRRLVQAMADNAGVLVIAALNVQQGSPGFEGPVIYCRPGVSYTARELIGR